MPDTDPLAASGPRTAAGRAMRRHLFPRITPFVMRKVTEDIIATEIEAYEQGCAATARALAPTPPDALREAAQPRRHRAVCANDDQPWPCATIRTLLPDAPLVAMHEAEDAYYAAHAPEEPA